MQANAKGSVPDDRGAAASSLRADGASTRVPATASLRSSQVKSSRNAVLPDRYRCTGTGTGTGTVPGELRREGTELAIDGTVTRSHVSSFAKSY